LKREIAVALWAMPEVKLQVRLISNTVRAKSGPYAFFKQRISQAFENVPVDRVLDDKYINLTAEAYIRKKNAYFEAIHSELDRLIEAELTSRGLDWTGVDLSEFHIVLTNLEIQSNRAPSPQFDFDQLIEN
jgi:hypothetical protein